MVNWLIGTFVQANTPEKSEVRRSIPISEHQVNGMANLPGYAN